MSARSLRPLQQSVFELHEPCCLCCRRYHLLYFFPAPKVSSLTEIWLVSTDRDSLLSHELFDYTCFSGTIVKESHLYGLDLIAAGICLLDIPRRVLAISPALFVRNYYNVDCQGIDGSDRCLLNWNSLMDRVAARHKYDGPDGVDSPF